jgi:ribosomal protein S1
LGLWLMMVSAGRPLLQQLPFPEIESAADLAVGKMVRGYVTETSASAVFVAISRSITGRMTRRDLGAAHIKNITAAFPVGKLVEAKVKTIGKKKSMSRRSSGCPLCMLYACR